MHRANGVKGRIVLPGDKSISHRAAILASIAEGHTEIENFAANADCLATVACMRELGVPIARSGSKLTVTGVGKFGLRRPSAELDCENSGTTMRLLAGVLAGQDFETVLTGDGSLRRRPMGRVIGPLAEMGARIGSDEGRAPLAIEGRRPLKACHHEPEAASAQIKSCLLLAGLYAGGETSVLERTPTRDHTERMLRWMGVTVAEDRGPLGARLSVSGDSVLQAHDLIVPADLSSAAFFIVAAALLDGSEIQLPGVGLNPSRTAVLNVLRQAGLEVNESNRREVNNEPIADLEVRGSSASASGRLSISGDVVANLIDEIPVLAVAGTQLMDGLEVTGAGELRIKESDRISAIVENLRRMNADVEEFQDGFRVGRSRLQGATVESFGDHRIAMAFAVAALFAEGETEIVGASAASVSFPAFFDELSRVLY